MAKKNRKMTASAKFPAADAVHLGDPKLAGRVFYRDPTSPGGSVRYAAGDPDAKGECVILPE